MQPLDRRRVLFIFGWVAGVLATAEAAWATLRFARAPVSYGPPRRWNLGPPESFASGASVYDEQAGVFVKRDAKGLSAMSSACTHLGCTVRRREGGFVCPCHGSRYDEEGRVVGGPAPSSLPYYRLELDRRGLVVVDLNRPADAKDRLKVTEPMKAFLERVHASVFRTGWPKDDRARLKAMHSSMLLHFHAAKVRVGSLRLSATWTMGFVSMVLLILLTATGIYLMFYYFPYPGVAYRSMKDLAFVVPFGKITRNLHRWGAHAMVITVTVHMLRVFLMGGYKTPREANWVAGVGLWFLTLALSFTGYLLPWDQLAFWAVTVGANMMGAIPWVGEPMRVLVLGDHIVGESALLRFYVLHCVLLPVVLGGLVAFHVYRVRKDGGLIASEHEASAPAKVAESEGKPAKQTPRLAHAWPHLIYRELVIGITVTAVLAACSLWLDAPLEPQADRTRTPNPAKAPWYFLGIQELAHYSAFWGGVFIPAAVVIGLCLLPYFDRKVVAPGLLFPRERRLACWLFIGLLTFMAVTTVVGTYFRGPGWAFMYWPN